MNILEEAKQILRVKIVENNPGINKAMVESLVAQRPDLVQKYIYELNNKLLLNKTFSEDFGKELNISATGEHKPPIKHHGSFTPAKPKKYRFPKNIFAALKKKSEQKNIPEQVLYEVFDRGLNAWNSNQKLTQEQFAFSRLNSFISKGKSYFNEDHDLVPFIEEFNPLDRGANIGWWRDPNKNEKITLYHGTNDRNLDSILQHGLIYPDPNTGMISTTPDPNTAHAYAGMVGNGNQQGSGFRNSAARAVPDEQRSVIKMEIPREFIDQHVDPRLGGNIGVAQGRMHSKDAYDSWKSENPEKSDQEYYAATEVRLNKPIPPEYFTDVQKKTFREEFTGSDVKSANPYNPASRFQTNITTYLFAQQTPGQEPQHVPPQHNPRMPRRPDISMTEGSDYARAPYIKKPGTSPVTHKHVRGGPHWRKVKP